MDCGCLRTNFWREYFDLRKGKLKENGESDVLSRCVICTFSDVNRGLYQGNFDDLVM